MDSYLTLLNKQLSRNPLNQNVCITAEQTNLRVVLFNYQVGTFRHDKISNNFDE